MANCNHAKCRNHAVCGHIAGDGPKNPGGNIHTTSRLRKHKTHRFYGWHSLAESNLYNNLIRSLNNGIIVEIGVYGGASLLGVIESCQQTNSHIYGVDPWEKISSANGMPLVARKRKIYRRKIKKIRLNLEHIIQCEGYDKNVTLVHDFSKNVAPTFKNGSVDVVFIDGDHSYDSVYEDLSLWLPKVKRGGTIWGDDFGWRSVQLAVHNFCANNNIKYQRVCGRRAWIINK